MSGYRLIAENSAGEKADLYNDDEIRLVSIEGISVEAAVNTAESYGDGSCYINSRIPGRVISITARYVRNDEKAKLRIYRIFRAKSLVTLRYISPNQDKYICGYVERCDTPPNVKPMLTSISVVCPDPFWRQSDRERVLLYGTIPMFEFPLEIDIEDGTEFGDLKTSRITRINYEGDADTGMLLIFEIRAECALLGLMNLDTKDHVSVSADFLPGDILKICTEDGRKSVILTRGAEEYDYFPKLRAGSRFLQLSAGENRFKIIVEGTDFTGVDIYCDFDILSGGV